MTYFEGSDEDGVPADDEAKRIWQEVGVADDHIIKGDKKVCVCVSMLPTVLFSTPPTV